MVLGGVFEVIGKLQFDQKSQVSRVCSERKGLGIYRISKLGQKSPNRLGVFTGVPDAGEDADEDAQLSI